MAATEDKSIDTVDVAVSIDNAKVLGVDANGGTKLFPLSSIVRSEKGVATPATVPSGQRFAGETWPISTAHLNVAYPGFGGITVTSKVGEQYTTNNRFVWNNGAWEWQKELVDVPHQDVSKLATKQEVNKLSQLSKIVANSNRVIGASGSLLTVAGINVTYINVVNGESYSIFNSLPSTGVNSKRAYAFYSALPLSDVTYISGSASISGAVLTDEVAVVPSGATILAFTDSGNATISKNNVSVLQGLLEVNKDLLSKPTKTDVDKILKKALIQSNANSGIGTTGSPLAIGAGWSIRYCVVSKDEVYRIVNSLGSTGGNIKMSYAFYSALPISMFTIISGSAAIGGAFETDLEVIVPDGATILALTDSNGSANLYRKNISLLESQEKERENTLSLFGRVSRVKPVAGTYRTLIGETGGVFSIGTDTMGIKMFPVIPGRKYRIFTTVASTGTNIKRGYGLYRDIDVSVANFVSGSMATGGGISINETITIPEGVNFVGLSDTENSSYIESELAVNSTLYQDPKYLRVRRNLLNVSPAPFFRGLNEGINATTSTVGPITGTTAGNDATYISVSGYKAAKSEMILGTKYTFTKVDGSNITPGQRFITMQRRDANIAYTMAFWLNVADLNGNDLAINLNGAETILNANLKTVGGGRATTGGGISVVIDAVDGDYSHFTVRFKSTAVDRNRTDIGVSETATSPVTQLRIVNPYIFEGYVYPDPYEVYFSMAELENSPLIGKNVVFFGDSQLANEQTFQTARILGASVKHVQEGGRAMKYRAAYAADFDMRWLYYWGRMKCLNDLKGDVFVFHCSTNDSAGGGILTEESINYVLNNYPNINDTDPAIIANKLALFGAISQADRSTYFNFKAVMGATIRQILIRNPDARIVLCTIPLSRGGETEISAIRARQEIYRSIRKDIYELGDFFNCPVIDVYNMVNLTAENAVYHLEDGTHWSLAIKQRIGRILAVELKKYTTGLI